MNVSQYIQYYNNISCRFILCMCKSKFIYVARILVTSICNCSPKCNCIVGPQSFLIKTIQGEKNPKQNKTPQVVAYQLKCWLYLQPLSDMH